MKRLALQTGGATVVGLLASCGLGYAAAGGYATAGLRDVSIIILALFSLVGSLLLGAISFAGAWAIGRFGPKAVAAVQKAGKLVGRAEDVTQSVVERGAVRPVARVSRLLTASATFVRSATGGHAPR